MTHDLGWKILYFLPSSVAIVFRQKINDFFVIDFIAISKLSVVAVRQAGSEVFA